MTLISGAGRCPRLWLVARKVRAERDRRFRIERNIDRAKLLVGVEVAVHARECLFLFGIGEIDAEEFLAALEDVLADSLFLSGRLRQRRQRQTAGDRSRDSFEEPPPTYAFSSQLHPDPLRQFRTAVFQFVTLPTIRPVMSFSMAFRLP